MARHELDGGTTKCSCKGGGCKVCGASNRLVSLHNDLIKFGLPKETLKSKLKEANGYLDKIDAYTLYEYLMGVISEEEFNQAVENYKTSFKRSTPKKKVSEVIDTTGRINPDKMCVYTGNSPWDRCIYCNSIRKYMRNKECLKYKENQGSTDTKNE